MQHGLQDVVSLEVILPAVEVDESSRRELALLVEHEPDAPAALLDLLPATPALRLTAGCALCTVDARQPAFRRVTARRSLQRGGIGHVPRSLRQPLEHRLGPLV